MIAAADSDGEGVVLGFSGGMDSCAAAARLAAQGWRVEAVTLDMTGDSRITDQARERAAEMGIRLTVKDVRAEFAAVKEYFVSSYAAGRTPAPCTLCNSMIKWPSLVAEADRRGIRAIATGHYFKTARHNGRVYVCRADDRAKDQSYYLWGLPQSTLERIVTPMGDIFKSDIRNTSPLRSESMGVCFLGGRPYAQYVAAQRPDTLRRGEIVDAGGRVVGHHDGVAFYTIGQKRGLEIDGEYALKNSAVRIVAIDAATNRIVVGQEPQLYYPTLEVASYNVVDIDELLSSHDVEVVIRGIGRNPEGYMRRAELIGDRLRITLGAPAWAPAAGQPAVFYRGDRVIGGGIVEKYF